MPQYSIEVLPMHMPIIFWKYLSIMVNLCSHMLIGWFHSMLIHREMLGGQLSAYCRFMLWKRRKFRKIALHILSTKHKPNEYLTRSVDCVAIWNWPPSVKRITRLKSSYTLGCRVKILCHVTGGDQNIHGNTNMIIPTMHASARFVTRLSGSTLRPWPL